MDEAHDGRVLDKTFHRRRALQQATEAFCPRAVESALAERRGGKTRMEGSIDLLDARSGLDVAREAARVASFRSEIVDALAGLGAALKGDLRYWDMADA